jgi:hypothetical protein
MCECLRERETHTQESEPNQVSLTLVGSLLPLIRSLSTLVGSLLTLIRSLSTLVGSLLTLIRSLLTLVFERETHKRARQCHVRVRKKQRGERKKRETSTASDE